MWILVIVCCFENNGKFIHVSTVFSWIFSDLVSFHPETSEPASCICKPELCRRSDRGTWLWLEAEPYCCFLEMGLGVWIVRLSTDSSEKDLKCSVCLMTQSQHGGPNGETNHHKPGPIFQPVATWIVSKFFQHYLAPDGSRLLPPRTPEFHSVDPYWTTLDRKSRSLELTVPLPYTSVPTLLPHSCLLPILEERSLISKVTVFPLLLSFASVIFKSSPVIFVSSPLSMNKLLHPKTKPHTFHVCCLLQGSAPSCNTQSL